MRRGAQSVCVCACALHPPRRGVEWGAGLRRAHPHQPSGYMLPERERERNCVLNARYTALAASKEHVDKENCT